MKKRKFAAFLLLMAIISVFTACSGDSDIYSNVEEDIELQKMLDDQNGLSGMVTAEQYLNWCQTAKFYAIPVIIISFIFGAILAYVFRNVKSIQSTGIFVFMIGIPVLTTVFVYVACFLYGKFF